MIVKKIKNENSKPKAWQIGDLVDYIRHPHNRNPQEKIEFAGGRNFISQTHNGQKLEMVFLAKESAHSKMPVTHWIFSWKEGEQPTREQVEELVDVFLERMELAGHQAIYGLHKDTDNYHLHIAVNRLNPETGKVTQPHKGFDKREAHKIVALIEQKQAWQSEKNSLYTVLENGELAKRRREREIKPRQPALDFEHAKGEKSAQRIAQERGHAIIKDAESWDELHRKLAEVGLRFEKKGSGAILFVGDIAIKASSVDRSFSMGKLCKKLGEFTSGEYTKPQQKLPPEPISSVNIEEWNEYQAEYADVEKAALDQDTDREIARLKNRQKQKRKKALSRLKRHGLSVLNIARHCLKVEQVEELRQLRRNRPKKRRGKPRFETWLRLRGLNMQADRWRYRAAFELARPAVKAQSLEQNMTNNLPETELFERYAAAVGADRYRVTCIKMESDGGKKTFILDKKDGTTKGFTPGELVSKMIEMLRLQRRGENIYYTPLSEEKHHILIDDMTAESLKKLKEDDFSPAVILESSPGNYQCVLTIPKLKTGFDRDVGNRVTERLNRLYGDKTLSGCIHPHRAPGFENRKPKHKRDGGGYPQVRLLFAEQRECEASLALTRMIDREYAESAMKKKTHPLAVVPSSARPGDPVSAYYAHLENIRKHLTIEDYSRVDAMIALRMRSTGHSRSDVAEAVRACAPSIREAQTRRDWQRYAERTADYAFGMAGDVALEKNDRYKDLWRRVEGIEDQSQPSIRMR